MTEPLIVVAGIAGALFGAWMLGPLWRQDEGRTLVAFFMWALILVLFATVVGLASR